MQAVTAATRQALEEAGIDFIPEKGAAAFASTFANPLSLLPSPPTQQNP
jgi:hypothetical protein